MEAIRSFYLKMSSKGRCPSRAQAVSQSSALRLCRLGGPRLALATPALRQSGRGHGTHDRESWYDFYMKKSGSSSKRGYRPASGMVLGRRRFEKISAVEGVTFTREMKKRAAEFDREGLSAEERRESIIRAYRKG